MTVKELTARAKELGIHGYSKMHKNELEQAVEKAELGLMQSKLQDAAAAHKVQPRPTSRIEAEKLFTKKAPTAVRDVAPIIDVSRMDPDLQSWILSQQMTALAHGLPINPQKFTFNALNGSETNMDHYGKFTQEIQGWIIVPVYNADGYQGSTMKKGLVEVPIHSALYPFFLDGTLTPVRLYGEDYEEPQHKLHAYQTCLIDIYNKTKEKGNAKVMLGNIKQTDPVLWIADLDAIKKVFGYNILTEDNPFKVTDLWRTTTKMQPLSKGTVRVRFVKAMEIYGVARNDGNLYGRMNLFFHPLHKENKRLMVKSCVQVRVSRAGLPEIKGNLYLDDYHYFSLSKELGFNPFEADIISTMDNVKGKVSKSTIQHGDVIEMPIEDLRIIGTSSRRGKSSYGIQLLCMGAEVDKFKAILSEHGLEEKGKLIREAMSGRLSAIVSVLNAQQGDSSFKDDQRELYTRCALFAIHRCEKCGTIYPGSGVELCTKCSSMVDDFIPMFTKNVSALFVRLNRMLSDELMKLKINNISPYIMPWDKLDHIEYKLHAEGKIVRFFCPPNVKRIKPSLEDKKTVLGANPVVAPFSIQTFVPIRENVLKTGEWHNDPAKDGPIVYNSSRDTFEISNQSAYMMIRDFDGDKVTVCFTNNEPPRTYKTVIMPEGPKGPKPEPPKSMGAAIQKLIQVSTSIAQAALDTGRVDLACREVYTDRLNAATNTNDPKQFLSLREAFKLGWKREKEIQGQKWTSGEGKQGDAAFEIKKELGLFDPTVKREQSLEYQLVHRHAFLPANLRADRHIFNRRLEIINTGKVNVRIPHWPGFVQLKDAKIETRHIDSIIIKTKMTDIWNGMVRYYAVDGKNKGWTFTPAGVEEYGKIIADYFASMGTAVMNEFKQTHDRKKRAEDFRLIGKNIRKDGMQIEVNNEVKKYSSLEQMREKYGEHAIIWERYLATWVCANCFGGSAVAFNNRFGDLVQPYSLGGGPLGYLSDDAKLYVGTKFNPANPELKKARKKLGELTKVEERTGRETPKYEDSDEEF